MAQKRSPGKMIGYATNGEVWQLNRVDLTKYELEETNGQGMTALTGTLRWGTVAAPEVVSILLAAGADPNTPDQEGNSPLALAADLTQRRQGLDCVMRLIEGGADIHGLDGRGRSALHRCASGAVEYLVACGSPIDAPDSKGASPLRMCVEEGRDFDKADKILALLQWGADPHLKHDGHPSALEVAEQKCPESLALMRTWIHEKALESGVARAAGAKSGPRL